MSSMNEIVKTLQDAVSRQTNQAKPTAYDTPAVVRRVEGDTAWVHIPDGVDETPVKMTINAKEGDQVQVRVSGGSAFMVGNGTAPPTDDAKAKQAYTIATVAEGAAENALANANLAKEAADTARGEAIRAGEAADRAEDKADDAAGAATSAQQSADSALVNLSTVQDVVGVLNWITAHGTMTLTSDVAVNPDHVYFIVDAGGDYVVGGTHYSIVSEPKDAELSTYYELSVDESVQNYVATHIAVDSEGLWLIPEDNATIASSSKKILIAVGGVGHTYSTAGTYIIQKVNGTDTVVAKFTQDEAIIGQNGSAHSTVDAGGATFYGGDGDTVLASFGTSSAQIGESQSQRIQLSSDGLTAYNGDSVAFFDVDYDGGTTTETKTIFHENYIASPVVGTEYTEIVRNEYSFEDLTGTVITPIYAAVTLNDFTVRVAEGVKPQAATISTVVNLDSTHFTYSKMSYRQLTITLGENIPDITVGSSSDISFTTNPTVTVTTQSYGAYTINLQIAYLYSSSTKTATFTCSAKINDDELDLSQARGFQKYTYQTTTTAPAFTLGTDGGSAKGSWSVRAGQSLAAESDNQTALGKFNANSASNALEIGNGTADNARSNALTVDWNGNVEAAGGADLAAMTESSGTYSGGLNDEALLTSATITKLEAWLNS